jgi:hypothetical protein
MGYRSDIMLVVYPDCTNDEVVAFRDDKEARGKHYENKYNTLKLLMQTKFKDVAETWDLEFDDDKLRLVISADNIKYYESYDEIAAFERLKDEIVELGYCMEFARIGEEYDDITLENMGHNVEYVIRINRYISLDD